MAQGKQMIGAPLVIGGRKLSLSRAIRAGDTVYLTGQIPIQNGMVMTTGSIEDQTRVVLDAITETLAEADFPGFNAVCAEYFPTDPPARSAVVNELLVDVRVEVEVVAWRPLDKGQAMHTADALTDPEQAPVVGLIHGLRQNSA